MAIDESQLVQNMTAELKAQADPSYRDLVRDRYGIDIDRFMGARTPAIHRIAGTYYRTIRSQPVDRRLELCEQLLETGLYELKIAAFRWAYLARKEFADPQLQVFSSWLNRYVDDWIDCDDLCVHVIGEFLRYPEQLFDHVTGKQDVMPRVTFRSAIEKLPESLRRKAMERYG